MLKNEGFDFKTAPLSYIQFLIQVSHGGDDHWDWLPMKMTSVLLLACLFGMQRLFESDTRQEAHVSDTHQSSTSYNYAAPSN